eukprot:10638733-Alexandrium_andersonii.AAC.1
MDLRMPGEVRACRIQVPVLAPHDIVAALHKAGPAQWETSMLGGFAPEDRLAFWEHFLEQPWGAQHPV